CNDPVTTLDYTLSLHDALPIYVFRQEKLGFIRKGNIAYSPVKRETRWVDYHTLDITFTYQVVSEEQIDYFESAIINGIVENEGGDRKSTRLNSSHVKISYAVFC